MRARNLLHKPFDKPDEGADDDDGLHAKRADNPFQKVCLHLHPLEISLYFGSRRGEFASRSFPFRAHLKITTGFDRTKLRLART